jgi:hypothetical protein
MALEVEVNKKDLDRALQAFPKRTQEEMYDAFDHIKRKFLKDFRQKRLQGPPGIVDWPGGLFRHFQSRIVVIPRVNGQASTDAMFMEIYTDSKVAQVHETGGVIHGKDIKVPLYARNQMFRFRKGARKLKNAFKNRLSGKDKFFKKINGKIFLMQRLPNHKVQALFVLKNQIPVQARLGFMKTWDEGENFRINRINKAIDKVFEA